MAIDDIHFGPMILGHECDLSVEDKLIQATMNAAHGHTHDQKKTDRPKTLKGHGHPHNAITSRTFQEVSISREKSCLGVSQNHLAGVGVWFVLFSLVSIPRVVQST